jgi:hypothetical protein
MDQSNETVIVTAPPQQVGKYFTMQTLISLAIHVIVATFYISNLSNKVERLSEVTSEIRTSQNRQEEQLSVRLGKIEADVTTCKVRLSIIEAKLEENKYYSQRD